MRPGENEELRFSLRSFEKNAAGLYRKVWIVGTVPEWASDEVGRIELEPKPEKFANIRQSVAALCADRRVASRVVIMNDDFFAIDPVREWQAHHLGSTAAYLDHLAKGGTTSRRNTWARAIEQTAAWMRDRGHGDINCYECHTPLMFDRKKLGALVAEYPADAWMLYTCFYPEAGAAGEGERAINVKIAATDAATVEKKAAAAIPYLSSNEASFDNGVVGGYIRAMFREPSRFERG